MVPTNIPNSNVVSNSTFPEVLITKYHLEWLFDTVYIGGFQKEQFPLLSHLDRNVDAIYGQKIKLELQKLQHKTSLCCQWHLKRAALPGLMF